MNITRSYSVSVKKAKIKCKILTNLTANRAFFYSFCPFTVVIAAGAVVAVVVVMIVLTPIQK